MQPVTAKRLQVLPRQSPEPPRRRFHPLLLPDAQQSGAATFLTRLFAAVCTALQLEEPRGGRTRWRSPLGCSQLTPGGRSSAQPRSEHVRKAQLPEIAGGERSSSRPSAAARGSTPASSSAMSYLGRGCNRSPVWDRAGMDPTDGQGGCGKADRGLPAPPLPVLSPGLSHCSTDVSPARNQRDAVLPLHGSVLSGVHCEPRLCSETAAGRLRGIGELNACGGSRTPARTGGYFRRDSVLPDITQLEGNRVKAQIRAGTSAGAAPERRSCCEAHTASAPLPPP